MTQVHIDIRRPNADGVDVPVRIGLTWSPTALRVVDDAYVLPESFGVIHDYAPVTVEVAPTELPTWVWRVRYEIDSVTSDHYLVVPDSPTPVEFTDLVEIDPATLSPVANPEAAWWVALEGVGAPTEEQVQEAVDDYLTANPVTPTTPEEIQDVVASFVVGGSNVTVTYDDVANTLTISSSGGGVGIEAVQWRSLTPGDTEPLIIWKPSEAEPDDVDGVEDGHLWLKRVVTP